MLTSSGSAARTWGVPDYRSAMVEQSSSDFFTIISPGGDYNDTKWKIAVDCQGPRKRGEARVGRGQHAN
jgi:hypothetical protein